MPTFDTPGPISVSLELGVADLRIGASHRRDTVVQVLPTDPSKKSDVALAEETLVECSGGILHIKAPRSWRQWAPWGGRESIDVRIELPAGSSLRGTAGLGSLWSTGRLGDCSYRTGMGDIHLEEAGKVELRSGAGDVYVREAAGHADIKTAGAVRIGAIHGSAAIKNSNGETWIGEITGDARVSAANGAITVDRAGTTIAAKTANGDVRLGEVSRGSVVAQSAYGSLEIGVRDGVSAWLDVKTGHGLVQNDLTVVGHPGPDEDTVEVRAHTSMGNITVYRSFAAPGEVSKDTAATSTISRTET